MLPNSSIEGIILIQSIRMNTGIREGSVYFDGKANGEEIFPSIEGNDCLSVNISRSAHYGYRCT